MGSFILLFASNKVGTVVFIEAQTNVSINCFRLYAILVKTRRTDDDGYRIYRAKMTLAHARAFVYYWGNSYSW